MDDDEIDRRLLALRLRLHTHQRRLEELRERVQSHQRELDYRKAMRAVDDRYVDLPLADGLGLIH